MALEWRERGAPWNGVSGAKVVQYAAVSAHHAMSSYPIPILGVVNPREEAVSSLRAPCSAAWPTLKAGRPSLYPLSQPCPAEPSHEKVIWVHVCPAIPRGRHITITQPHAAMPHVTMPPCPAHAIGALNTSDHCPIAGAPCPIKEGATWQCDGTQYNDCSQGPIQVLAGAWQEEGAWQE